MSKAVHISLLLIILLFTSCIKQFKTDTFSTNAIVPLATADLSIKDIIADTLYREGTDNSITLIYNEELFRATIDSIFVINTDPYQNTAKLQALKLSPQTMTRTITLGEVAAQAGATGQVIISQHGTNAIIPPIPGLTAGPFNVNANEYFETADLLAGYMDISIENNFPTDLSNVSFEIRNLLDSSLVANDMFAYITAGTTELKTVDLAGKTVYGELFLNVTNMDVVGTGLTAVPIDTSDNIVAKVTVRDLQLQAATAIFPAQNIIDTAENRTLANMDDVQLTYADIESGFIRIDAYSTVKDTVYFSYSIPGTTYNGTPFEMNLVLPPAPMGGVTHEEVMYDLTDYAFDFTGENEDTVNTFFTQVTARIDSTGQLATISLEDSVYLYLEVIDLKPSYARGYLGQDTLQIGPAINTIDVFDFMPSGILNFEEVNLTMNLRHGFGLESNVDVRELSAINSKTGVEKQLDLTSIAMPLSIASAVENPFQEGYSTFALTSQNSNPEELFNIMPDQIKYDIEVKTNRSGNDFSYSDFAYNDYPFRASVDIELPLSILASQLLLTDTVDFEYSGSQNFDQIASANLTLHIENELPISAQVKLYFLNAGTVVDSLVTDDIVKAGVVDTDGNILTSEKTEIIYVVNNNTLSNLSTYDQVIFKAVFDSEPPNEYVKILSTNSIHFSLTSNFDLIVE